MNNSVSSFYQSTSPNSSTSTLRPRTTRLISYVEDESSQNETVASTASTTSTPPRFDSRSASPSAAGVRARSTRHDRAYQLSPPRNVDRRASGPLWDSWPSIQGIASTFLGSDISSASNAGRTSSLKKSGRMQQDKNGGSLKSAIQEWGPKTQIEAKSSSVEDQKALLQAKKREALLSSSADWQRDTLGRYKRKDSNADIIPYGAGDVEDDVLLYRHQVLPQDTMAGVVIKYNCQPEVFRKLNRFWPNDRIQRRDFVVLPVNACGVRGRKVDGPNAVDLLHTGVEGDSPSAKHTGEKTDALRGVEGDGANDPPLAEPFPPAETKEEDQPYRHDSWIVIPSFPQPVEVLRASKRVLGYFPPTRRKSNTNSPFTDLVTSTPKTSFDMLRHPPTHAAQQAQLQQQQRASASPNSSPVRQPSLPRHLTNSSRNRSSSTVSAANGTSNPFMTVLQGPGGVGALRGLRTERARPGPGEDPLNKKFAQYIPDLLPPEQERSSSLLRPVHSRPTSSSLRATPRASTDSIRSTRSNSSTVPAAIEGWMRKVTGSGAVAVATSPMRKKGDLSLCRNDSSDLLGAAAGGESGFGMADLIELDVTPDAVSRQLHDDVDVEDLTPTATAMPTPLGDESGKLSKTEEELLNERFPIRGRVRRAYEAD